jgi:hypothetical protein
MQRKIAFCMGCLRAATKAWDKALDHPERFDIDCIITERNTRIQCTPKGVTHAKKEIQGRTDSLEPQPSPTSRLASA